MPELRKEYGIDLTETVNGYGMSPGLVLIHVRALPDSSHTKSLLNGSPEWAGWSYERHLLASIFDIVRENTMLIGSPNYKEPLDLPSWPRPGSEVEEDPEPQSRSIEDLWKSLATM